MLVASRAKIEERKEKVEKYVPFCLFGLLVALFTTVIGMFKK